MPQKLKFKKEIDLDFDTNENIKNLLEKDDLDIVFRVTEVEQKNDTIIIKEAIIKNVSIIKNSHKT